MKNGILIFFSFFPRILNIIKEIDQRFEEELIEKNLPEDLIQSMSPIHDGKVHMALLACYSCYSVNGVAAIHSNLLKNVLFKDFTNSGPENLIIKLMELPPDAGS